MQSCCIWAIRLPVFSPCLPNCVLLQYCLDRHKEKKGHLQGLYLCFICPMCGDLKHFPWWHETCPTRWRWKDEAQSKPNTESGVVPSGLLLIRLVLFEVETGLPLSPSSPTTTPGCFHGQGGMFKSSFKMWCRGWPFSSSRVKGSGHGHLLAMPTIPILTRAPGELPRNSAELQCVNISTVRFKLCYRNSKKPEASAKYVNHRERICSFLMDPFNDVLFNLRW